MQKFYRLLDDVHIPGRWHLSDPMTDEGCNEWDFQAGRILRLASMPIVDIKIPGIPLDYTPTLLDVPVAAPRLVKGISHLSVDDVQRIPVRLGSREGYEILNIIRLFRCLDEKKSEFTKWTEKDARPDRLGQYHSVFRVRIDIAAVPEDVIFSD